MKTNENIHRAIPCGCPYVGAIPCGCPYVGAILYGCPESLQFFKTYSEFSKKNPLSIFR
ncbi:MAG: hypothetical protein KAI83_16985 [Thiomargarita sp.]|nr:hypothetical protein [Thiomargarita sp.]